MFIVYNSLKPCHRGCGLNSINDFDKTWEQVEMFKLYVFNLLKFIIVLLLESALLNLVLLYKALQAVVMKPRPIRIGIDLRLKNVDFTLKLRKLRAFFTGISLEPCKV